jgi:PAS domain S-box-containing protein
MLVSSAGIFLDLLLNLTLLVALSILSGFIEKRLPRSTSGGVLMQGVLFGLTTVIGMLRPLVLGPGLIFDGRSVMISLCALFFGPVAVAVAAFPVIAYRVTLGGPGMVMGVLTVLSSSAIGLATRYRFKPVERPPMGLQLYAFGLVVHVAMLLGAFTIPDAGGLATLQRIGLPVMLLYPLATILAGKILSDQVASIATIKALRDSEERFKLSMEATSDGLWDLDVASDRAYYNPAYYHILGYEPDEFEASGQTWRQLLHPDDLEKALAADQDCIEGRKEFIDAEYRMKAKNCEWRWIYTRGKCISRGKDGRAMRLVGTHLDITDRKVAEERLMRSLAEKEVLLREVHHRVKNNLNVVSSLLNLQSAVIETPEQALVAFQNSRDRIMAMSLAHEELYKSQDYSQVDMSQYLGELFNQLLVAYDAEGRIQLSLDVRNIVLSVNAAIPCGLIINELITNAFKYAYPDSGHGEVRVSLSKLGDGSLELRIADDGIGFSVDQPAAGGSSLGLTLVKLLVDQLGGELEVTSHPGSGSEFRIRFRDGSPE